MDKTRVDYDYDKSKGKKPANTVQQTEINDYNRNVMEMNRRRKQSREKMLEEMREKIDNE